MNLIDLDDSAINENLKITDLENAFDIFVDERMHNMFNLNQSVYIRIDKDSLPEFQCNHAMHWPLISYKIYGTTRLAWVLWKVNDVSLEDMFKAKQPSEKVKYLPKDLVQNIISELVNFNKQG